MNRNLAIVALLVSVFVLVTWALVSLGRQTPSQTSARTAYAHPPKAGQSGVLVETAVAPMPSSSPPEVEASKSTDTSFRSDPVREGSVAGRVYDLHTGEGVVGAKIQAFLEGTGDEQAGQEEVTTDVSGKYIIGLREGQYGLFRGETPGYARAEEWDQRRVIQVNGGREVTGVDFGVSKGAPISGRVVDVSGNPVNGARVEGRILAEQGNAADTMSSNGGTFSLTGLHATRAMAVRASKGDAISSALESLRLPPEGLHDVLLTLEPAAAIEGEVVDKSGKPLSGIWVQPRLKDGEIVHAFETEPLETDSQGHFRFDGIAPAAYEFSVRRTEGMYFSDKSCGVVELKPRQRVTGITLVYEDPKGLTISGRVTNAAGQGLKGTGVNVDTPQGLVSSETDSTGAYRVDGLPEGRFSMTAEHSDYSRGQRENVSAGSVNVDFTLGSCGIIEGRIVSATMGKPVTDFEILTEEAEEESEFRPWMWRDLRKMHDDEGAFRLTDVQVGPTILAVRASGYVSDLRFVGTVTAAQPLKGVNVRLDTGSSVVGVVRTAAGQPVAGAMIFTQILPDLDHLEREALARSKPDGTFRVAGLVGDEVTLVVYKPGLAATSVYLPTSPARRVTVVLSGGGTLEGAVIIGGQPAPGQWVKVHTFDGTGRDTETAADGTFRCKNLPTGEGLITVYLGNPLNRAPSGRSDRQSFLIEEGKTTTVNFDFPSGGAVVEGTISRDGAPLSASVSVQASNERPFRVQSDADGHYRVEGLPAGPTTLHITVLGQYGEPGFINNRAYRTDLTEGGVTRFDVDLSRGAKILGSVQGFKTGDGGTVWVFRGDVGAVELTPQWLQQHQDTVLGNTGISADGAVRIDGLEPGVYTLVAAVTREGEDARSDLRQASAIVKVGENGESAATLVLP